MTGVISKLIINHQNVQRAEDRLARKSLFKAAATVRTIAKRSIKTSRVKKNNSTPGRPPLSHRGRLRKAILFNVDVNKRTAIIGPSASVVGTSGAAHEFGGSYKGGRFPKRPFMGPALDKSQEAIARFFAGEFK